MKTAFLFPGQGAQQVGMGRDFYDSYEQSRKVYDRANEIVGYDLAAICFEGPEDKLNSTTVSQPAIFVTSAAILAAMAGEEGTRGILPDVTAGLSLGEYTALYAAGRISFEDGVRLVQRRGEAMQAAADATEGAMVSIIGLEPDKVQELCAEAANGDILKGVNFNCPGQVVVSGSSKACDRAEALADKYGAIKAVRLAVAGGFHTELMSPAADALAEALENTEVSHGQAGVLANIDAEYYGGADAVKDGLVKQLTQPLLWQKCMERLIDEGVEKFYEVGPGRVLTGLMRRIHRKTRVANVSSLSSMKKLLES